MSPPPVPSPVIGPSSARGKKKSGTSTDQDIMSTAPNPFLMPERNHTMSLSGRLQSLGFYELLHNFPTDLPDKSTVTTRMNKIAAESGLDNVSNVGVDLVVQSMESYLKNIISKSVEVHRQRRQENTELEFNVESRDLMTAIDVNPHLISEDTEKIREKVSNFNWDL
eukprot:gb/GECH01014507.1/.p1 GENE.gb/GECH01014507.1/~~gb/GECH01014507.1/.p1  ORF type:complete len:167 (+),score=51.52 gb/GECH01014507.1/:1-501(+)